MTTNSPLINTRASAFMYAFNPDINDFVLVLKKDGEKYDNVGGEADFSNREQPASAIVRAAKDADIEVEPKNLHLESNNFEYGANGEATLATGFSYWLSKQQYDNLKTETDKFDFIPFKELSSKLSAEQLVHPEEFEAVKQTTENVRSKLPQELFHNPILNTDSYKPSHYLQYEEGTTDIVSYIEARGGEYNHAVFVGLQAFMKEYLTKPITQADIDMAEFFIKGQGLPFNREGWEYILKEHDGHLPIEIQAVKEGSAVPTGNALVQIRNTDPNCAWLTSYVETALLRAVWYPTSVATLSASVDQTISKYLDETSDNPDNPDKNANRLFMLHDFGGRGASSQESAAVGSLGHQSIYKGSDTIAGVIAANMYYDEPISAYSVPAAEHSSMTIRGRLREAETYKHMLDVFGAKEGDPRGKIVAVVSDSYDLMYAIKHIWGDELKDAVIENGKHGGRLVIRPDSGDPVQVVSDSIEALMDKFGSTTNSKGYKVLPDYLRVLQGDGINKDSIKDILEEMKKRHLSTDNIVFGMGGKLLQGVNRDTLSFAQKACAAKVNGVWKDVVKDPVTDQGKRSKPGIQALVKDDAGKFITVREDELNGRQNLLESVFKDGELKQPITFKDLRSEIVVNLDQLKKDGIVLDDGKRKEPPYKKPVEKRNWMDMTKLSKTSQSNVVARA